MNQIELNDALIQAADCDLESAKELVKSGANPTGMPLIMAIQCGAEDVVSFFIKNGANVNIGYSGTTPLIRAVTSGYPNIVKLLIDHGADINAQDSNNQTAVTNLNNCTMPRLTAQNKKLIAGYLKV